MYLKHNKNITTRIFILIKRLWGHIPQRRKKHFGLLMILMFFASIAEAVSIGTVIPFIGILADPSRILSNETAQQVIRFFALRQPSQLLTILTLVFAASAILAGITRLVLLWYSTKLSFITGADLSINIYRRTLYQPYSIHCSRNSSEIVNGISSKANNVIYTVVVPVLTLFSSAALLMAVVAALLFIDPKICLLSFIGFSSIYIIINLLTKNRMLDNSRRIAGESTKLIKCLQEALGGIRDVLIDGSQETYCEFYRKSDSNLRNAQADNLFISYCPRYGLEALGMVLISGLVLSLTSKGGGFSYAIPTLGAMALGAQRMLPVLQQAHTAWSQICGGCSSLEDTLNFLDQPLPQHFDTKLDAPIAFSDNIRLNNVSFGYSTIPGNVLIGVDLMINKGDRVGFIGSTGSGKSTMIDVIMALLTPSDGSLEIDGIVINHQNCRSWQRKIAHVPQSIFLTDSTVAENIAFGIPVENIDHDEVKLAAQQAQISETIESLPNGYQTEVGERGVRLSGGQRQRIGIARALYKKAAVIILDEATSALDTKTERLVMDSINQASQNLTILIIAHRIATLRGCNKIVELESGRVKRIVGYSDIV